MQIDHVNIVVQDLERMVAFYRDSLGLIETKRVTITGPWVSATVGLKDVNADVVYLDLESGPRIELIRYNVPSMDRPDGVDRPNAPGLRHIAFRIDTEVLDAASDTLRDQGILVKGPVDFPTGRRSYFFEDPDQHYIELTDR